MRSLVLSSVLLVLSQSASAGESALISVWQQETYGYTERSSVEACPSELWHCEPLSFSTSVTSLDAAPGFAPLVATLAPFFREAISSISFGSIFYTETHDVSAQIRAGYLQENPDQPFKGNVLFYEGLGDSMLNHLPLFRELTSAGYRVITFDYMGQGGSTGNMDDTRIEDIPKIGNLALRKFAREPEKFPKRIIIGWSTGGLAAYYAAVSGGVDQVVLIAPGIAPNAKVGTQEPSKLKFDEITLSTLTTQTYERGEANPHIDPIRPTSPLTVPDFSVDLQSVALIARHDYGWKVPSEVKGFVLLSGDNDTYVNASKTRKVLAKQAPAPQFQIRQYAGALHEIDNEVPSISLRARKNIVNFISGADLDQGLDQE